MNDWYKNKKLKEGEIGPRFIDETDNKYKSFIAIKPIKKNNLIYWLCKCDDCGAERLIQATKLRRGRFNLCSCDPNHGRSSPVNHEGEHRYLWSIKERVNDGRKGVYHRCICDCGLEKVIEIKTIIQGKSKSCGCLGVYNIKEYTLNIKKKPYNIAALEELYKRYKSNADNKNMEFNLTREEFKNLIKSNCFYCGEEPYSILVLKRKSEPNPGYLYNGIDRVDNKKGYLNNNVVSCCRKCNLMKHILSDNEFLAHVEKIFNYQKNKLLCQSA